MRRHLNRCKALVDRMRGGSLRSLRPDLSVSLSLGAMRRLHRPISPRTTICHSIALTTACHPEDMRIKFLSDLKIQLIAIAPCLFLYKLVPFNAECFDPCGLV